MTWKRPPASSGAREIIMLDAYLNSLNEEEKEKTASQARFGAASVVELAKMAGVGLGGHVCTNCGDAMEKLGSIYRCRCGMMKRAKALPPVLKKNVKKVKAVQTPAPGAEVPSGLSKKAMSKCGKCGSSMEKTSMGKSGMCGACGGGGVKTAARSLPPALRNALIGGGALGAAGAGSGALMAGEGQRGAGALAGGIGGAASGALGAAAGTALARRMGPTAMENVAARVYSDPKLLERLHSAARARRGQPLAKLAEDDVVKEAASKILELVDVCDGDLEKVAVALGEQGMSKEAIGGILSAIGRGAKGIWQAGRGAGGVKAGLSAAGKAVTPAAKGVGEAAKTYGRGMGAAAQKGYAAGGGGARGALGAVGEMARQSPGTAAALAGGAGLGGGYMMGKKGSAEELTEVGDAAGRLLAKMAMAPDMNQPIPIEEIRESIEEAQAREDIPGRARRWQVGGGAGGGALGGAAGYGAGRLIGPKAGLVGMGVGALGGALGGQHLGKEYGAEEARADKAVAMLRALRAHQAGAMTGYGAGMRRGYEMGGQPLMETEKTSGAKKIVDRLTG
jgi:hypothetical protein